MFNTKPKYGSIRQYFLCVNVWMAKHRTIKGTSRIQKTDLFDGSPYILMLKLCLLIIVQTIFIFETVYLNSIIIKIVHIQN